MSETPANEVQSSEEVKRPTSIEVNGIVVPDVSVHMVRDDCTGFPAYELPAGFRYRMYRDGDEATWTALQTAAEPFFAIAPDLFAREYGEHADALPDRMFFVETEDGEPVASISSWWDKDRHNPQERGRIHWVVVHPKFQRLGITKPMMTRAMQRIAELHSTGTVLGTSTGRVWAIKVYLDYGFYPEPVELQEKPEVAEAWHTLQKVLNHPLLAKSLG